MRSVTSAGLAALGFGLLLLGLGPSARAETGWVRGEVRLNLRTGPGSQYRILGVLKTGDAVSVLARGEGWTQVRTRGGQEGWVPAGYLDPEPPPVVRLERTQAELGKLRQELERLRSETQELREQSETLGQRAAQQARELERLRAENLDLKAGQRWPYLITGASILAAGMLIGALLQRAAARRPQPRIRF